MTAVPCDDNQSVCFFLLLAHLKLVGKISGSSQKTWSSEWFPITSYHYDTMTFGTNPVRTLTEVVEVAYESVSGSLKPRGFRGFRGFRDLGFIGFRG